jgi:hypothetical protein
MPKQFFVPISHRIAEGRSKRSHLALPADAAQLVQVWSKSVGNERHIILDAETAFRPYVASHCCGLTEGLHLALASHALESLQVWSKSAVKAGTLLLRPKGFFVPIWPCNAAAWMNRHSWHSLFPLNNIIMFGQNGSVTKDILLLRRKQFFRPYVASPCSRVIDTCQLLIPAIALGVGRLWSKAVGKGHHILEA